MSVEAPTTSNAPADLTLPPPPIVIVLPAVVTAANILLSASALASISPANVALKSDASVKIVSSMTLRLLLPVLLFAVADRNLILPPACVPLPAPPRNIKSPPAPWSAVFPPRALPAVIVSVLPFSFGEVLANCVMVEAALSAPIVIAPVSVEAPVTSNAPPVTTLPPPPIVIALPAVVTAANIFLASSASATI